MLALKDFQDQDIEDVLKRPAFCPKPGHEKKELEFFCKNCEEPICNSCAATLHDGHVKILLEEAANERKFEVKTVVESQKEKAQDIRNKIAQVNVNYVKIQEKVANVKRSVQQFADIMMAVIEAKKHNDNDNGNNRVQVFSSDGMYLRSFGTKGNKQGEFDFPSGIAFDNNGNILVADSRNNRVQMFSEQGDYQGSLDHQVKRPHGLSADNDGNIVVADKNNKLIKIFSPSGQFLRKFGGEGSLTCPYHCVQYDKYLIVSDSDEHCMKVFDRDGNFMHKFGKKGEGDGEFNIPRCLSVNKAGHLMVCDAENDRVQVFELSGKFITKFGTKGSGIGEFNRPVSTAVLSDGRIVVSDLRNSRIHIFE